MIAACIIYALIDPRTLLVRYIGKSLTGLERPKKHRQCDPRKTGPYCRNWIKELLAVDLDYEIAVLDVGTKENLSELECYWIAFGRACGWPLTNLTAGGDGFTGEFTAEHRAKLSAALRGRPVSANTRSKMAEKARAQMKRPEMLEALRKRTFTPEWKAKISASRKALMQDPAEREKIAAPQRGRALSAEHRANVVSAARTRKTTKLTIDGARTLFLAVRASEPVAVVALRYGVSPRHVRDVVNGRRWKEVSLEHGAARSTRGTEAKRDEDR